MRSPRCAFSPYLVLFIGEQVLSRMQRLHQQFQKPKEFCRDHSLMRVIILHKYLARVSLLPKQGRCA